MDPGPEEAKGGAGVTTDEMYADLIGECLSGDKVTTRNSECYRSVCKCYRFHSAPLVGVRKTAWKSALREWQWFMSGSNIVDDLHPAAHSWWEPFAVMDGRSLPHNYAKALRRLYAPGCGREVNIEPKVLDADMPPPVPQFPKRDVADKDAKHLGYSGTNCHGDRFRVVDYIGDSVYVVQFESNGFCVNSRPGNFLKGTVKNPYYPTVNGVGCYGVPAAESCTYSDRAYELWCGFMGRCYNPARRSYRWYGEKGVKVAARWKCFEYFLQDLPRIAGFEEWVAHPTGYELDKDHYRANYYGPDSCVFLPRSDNLSLSHSDRRGEETRREIEVDQIANLIDGIIHHPHGRRHVITTWVPHHVAAGLINPTNCHNTVTQLFVRGDALNMRTYQRSADVVCGVPHNWIQQWAFLMWLARRTGKAVGWLQWEGGDCHVYETHLRLAQKIYHLTEDYIDGMGKEPPQLVYMPTSDEFLADNFTLSGPYDPLITERAEMVV